MTHIAPLNHVDDVLADILRVIANAFERASTPGYVHDALDRARVFHHERDALALNCLVFFVDPLILADDLPGFLDIQATLR